MDQNIRKTLKDRRRIVIKIGSSSLTHKETGDLNLAKIERLTRVISDLRGMGKEIVLVSSGAMPPEDRRSARRNRRACPKSRRSQRSDRRA